MKHSQQIPQKSLKNTALFLLMLSIPLSTYATRTPEPEITPAEILEATQDTLDNGVENYTQQGFSNDGLYGCQGGKLGSVGKKHAGGIFVPVSEEAVALNTHILLYKECILDGVVARVRETMVSFMVKSTFNWVNKNNNGESAFVTNQAEFRLKTSDKVVRQFTEGDRTEGIFEGFRQDIRQSLARGYAQSTRNPEAIYKHSIPDNKKEAFTEYIEGRGNFSWDMFLLAAQPENNPIGAYSMALNQMVADIDEKVSDEYKELDWGNGYKSHKNCKQLPAGNGTYEEHCNIATPGANIKNIIDYVSLTGHRQTENADEIDELMGSLMSNIHTQILTSVGGLRGISQSTGGATYVDRVAGDAADRTRTEYTDIGTNALASALATEGSYGAARKGAQSALEATAKQLEAKDAACWDGLIARAKIDAAKEAAEIACTEVQQNDFGGQNQQGECTIQGTATAENIAGTVTYTDLAQAQEDGEGRKEYNIKITARAAGKTVTYILSRHSNNSFNTIASEIAPLLRVINQSVADSVKAVTILANLQDSLENSNSQGNTRFVLEQVDQLVAAGALHSESDIYTAETQQKKINDAMEELYDDTVKAWDAGWCNPANWRDQIQR